MVPVLFSGLNTVGYGRSVSHDIQHLSVRSLCPCVRIYTSVGLGKKREFRRLCNNSSEFEFLDDSVKRHTSNFFDYLTSIYMLTTPSFTPRFQRHQFRPAHPTLTQTYTPRAPHLAPTPWDTNTAEYPAQHRFRHVTQFRHPQMAHNA